MGGTVTRKRNIQALMVGSAAKLRVSNHGRESKPQLAWIKVLRPQLKRHDITLNRFGIPKSVGF